MCKSQGIKASEGTCGDGVYGFRIEEDTLESFHAAYNKTCGGGYCKGAAFIMECNGLLVKGGSGETVPPGAISCIERKQRERDQYSANPTAVAYVSVILHIPALVHELGLELHSTGYSVALHEALSKAAAHLAGGRGSSSNAGQQICPTMVKVSNKLVHDTGCGTGLLRLQIRGVSAWPVGKPTF